MTIVERVAIRRILDSRGRGTVEVDVHTAGGFGRAAAPSGASTGVHEVQAFPEGGIDVALSRFRDEVAPRLLGLDAASQGDIDRTLHDVDATSNFSRIGGNVAVATSLAAAKAAASAVGVPLYRHLDGALPDRLPRPLGNVIGGGRHATGGTTIQEFLALAEGDTFADAVFANARVHDAVRDLLRTRLPDLALGRGDEGAWVAPLADTDALAILAEACDTVAKEVGFAIRPSLDMAASEFFVEGEYRYRDRSLSTEKQIEFVADLVETYDLAVVEDPLEQEDFEGYARLTELVGAKCLIVGDDLFVTNVERLRRGVDLGAANAVLIKPNQIGTLTDTRRAVDLAHRERYATVMSHRSGETTDDAIAHLAVAYGCYAIKTGTVGGERTAKLNELIRIEEELVGD
jgi:enolase